MLDEIISVYSKQFQLYSNVSDALSKFESSGDKLDITEYYKELENTDKTLDMIKELNDRIEVLKLSYVSENKIKDFIGTEIKKVESPESYMELKIVISNVTGKIADIKKMQDRVMANITRSMNVTKTLLQEVNSSKQAVKSYKKPEEENKEHYINKKK